jgi:hypothetical protein
MLLVDDDRHVALRFHDLRATGITMRAVRGDNPYEIQQDAGHEDFAVTQGYIRTARRLGPEFGDPFPARPDNLLRGGSPGLTRSQVARRLGVSVTRVRRLEGVELHPTMGPRGCVTFVRKK